MWDDPEEFDLETFKKKHKFGTWQTIGKTTYMFDITIGGVCKLKIKYD